MNFQKNKLFILAGGRGSRIKKINRFLPKPLIKFNNISLLNHLISQVSVYQFDEIVILAGYRSNQIVKKFHDSDRLCRRLPLKLLEYLKRLKKKL